MFENEFSIDVLFFEFMSNVVFIFHVFYQFLKCIFQFIVNIVFRKKRMIFVLFMNFFLFILFRFDLNEFFFIIIISSFLSISYFGNCLNKYFTQMYHIFIVFKILRVRRFHNL